MPAESPVSFDVRHVLDTLREVDALAAELDQDFGGLQPPSDPGLVDLAVRQAAGALQKRRSRILDRPDLAARELDALHEAISKAVRRLKAERTARAAFEHSLDEARRKRLVEEEKARQLDALMETIQDINDDGDGLPRPVPAPPRPVSTSDFEKPAILATLDSINDSLERGDRLN